MKRLYISVSRVFFSFFALAFKLILIFTVLISNLAKLKFGPTSRYLKELEDLTGLFLYKNTDLYKNKNISEYNPYLYNRYMREASAAFIGSQIKLSSELLTKASLIKEETANKIGILNPNFALLGPNIASSIGHTAITLALRVKMAKLFPNTQKNFLLVYSNSANQRYLELWKKYFPMIRVDQGIDKFIEHQLWPIYDEISYIRIGTKTYDLHEAHDEFTRLYTESHREPMLTLEGSDKECGYKFLKEKGFDIANGWFVTLHVRNSPEFLNGRNKQTTYGRNARIETYQKTVDHILDCGGFVVRIGTDDGHRLENKSGYIDYSSEANQNDVLNTFFLGECRFLIGTNSGPICVPPTFGRPVLTTNGPGIGINAYFPNSILLPKLVVDEFGSVLSLKETLTDKSGWTYAWLGEGNNRKYKWRDNSEEEIYEATLEMLKGVESKASPLQSNFESVLRSYGSKATTLVSNSFLLKWADTLL